MLPLSNDRERLHVLLLMDKNKYRIDDIVKITGGAVDPSWIGASYRIAKLHNGIVILERLVPDDISARLGFHYEKVEIEKIV